VTRHSPAVLALPADARSPKRARDFVVDTLMAWRLDGYLEVAKLLTSELVTNAVMHARTDLTVTVERDDQRQVFKVSVADAAPKPPRRRRFSQWATTGRGIAMVESAASQFGTTTSPDGKAVWFEFPLVPDDVPKDEPGSS
jgi:anti-sigma regulatory factor (Ser/Thr protein kinase)